MVLPRLMRGSFVVAMIVAMIVVMRRVLVSMAGAHASLVVGVIERPIMRMLDFSRDMGPNHKVQEERYGEEGVNEIPHESNPA